MKKLHPKKISRYIMKGKYTNGGSFYSLSNSIKNMMLVISGFGHRKKPEEFGIVYERKFVLFKEKGIVRKIPFNEWIKNELKNEFVPMNKWVEFDD